MEKILKIILYFQIIPYPWAQEKTNGIGAELVLFNMSYYGK